MPKMLERITHQELRQLAILADKARRSYRDTEPVLTRRFEAAASAAVYMAESQERSALFEEIQHQLEQVKIELGVLSDPIPSADALVGNTRPVLHHAPCRDSRR